MTNSVKEARQAPSKAKQQRTEVDNEVRDARAHVVAAIVQSLDTLQLGHVYGLDYDDLVPLEDVINSVHDGSITALEKLAEELEKHAGGTAPTPPASCAR